jgi:hypothetical protein
MTPTVPRRWTVRGELPNLDPLSAEEADLALLDEDLIQVSDPSGAYTIDVGWYPAAQRDGRFVCRIVRSSEWDSPIEQVETGSKDAVRQWLKRSVDTVQSLLGRQGEFSAQVGLFIYAKTTKTRRKQGRPTKRSVPVTPTIRSPSNTREPMTRDSIRQLSSSATTPLQLQL